jgi:hypothetical protein
VLIAADDTEKTITAVILAQVPDVSRLAALCEVLGRVMGREKLRVAHDQGVAKESKTASRRKGVRGFSQAKARLARLRPLQLDEVSDASVGAGESREVRRKEVSARLVEQEPMPEHGGRHEAGDVEPTGGLALDALHCG